MRKRLLWLSLALALFLSCVILLLWLLRPPPSPVTRAAFERLKPGMSLAEVEAVLGGPPGDYRTGEVVLDNSGGHQGFHEMMHAEMYGVTFRHEWWQGDEGTAWVCFDGQGRAVTKEFTPGRWTRALTPLERLEPWLKRWGW